MKETLEALVMTRCSIANREVTVEVLEPTNTVRIEDKRLGVTIDLTASKVHDLIERAFYE